MTPREFNGNEGWYVEVRWADGPKEHVGRFASEAEARCWINHAPNDRLPQHLKNHE